GGWVAWEASSPVRQGARGRRPLLPVRAPQDTNPASATYSAHQGARTCTKHRAPVICSFGRARAVSAVADGLPRRCPRGHTAKVLTNRAPGRRAGSRGVRSERVRAGRRDVLPRSRGMPARSAATPGSAGSLIAGALVATSVVSWSGGPPLQAGPNL